MAIKALEASLFVSTCLKSTNLGYKTVKGGITNPEHEI